MTPEEKEILISAYIDGEVTPEELIQVRKLLDEDDEARRFYREMINLNANLSTWPDESLSPDCESNISKRAGRAQQEGKAMEKSNTIPMVAMSLLIAFVVGAVVYRYVDLKNMRSQMVSLSPEQQHRQQMKRDEGRIILVEREDYSSEDERQILAKKMKNFISSDSKPVEAMQLAKVDAVQYEPYYQTQNVGADDYRVRRSNGFTQRSESYRNEPRKRKERVVRRFSYEYSQKPEYIGNEPRSRQAYSTTSYSETVASKAVSPMMGYVDTDSMGGGYGYSQPADPYRQQYEASNREGYNKISDNEFKLAKDNPLSTFSIDVDTASYSNMRRFLNQGRMPPKDAVRIEEMVNYFDYQYDQPRGSDPFSITMEAAPAPWKTDHQLVMIGLKGKEILREEISASNLVFLLDVSGSMSSANKLPLLQRAFAQLVDQLTEKDTVSIIVYAGSSGMVLPPTNGSQKEVIKQAIYNLRAGGSTAGAAGIKLAYQTALQNHIANGNNRVILATDGDFNVGVSGDGELIRLIEEKRKQDVFLTILGFGQGNYQDGKMEQIANKGNGNYFYIDSDREARKVLVEDLMGTMFTIAKDVKLQIEFNPSQVKAYRLIGYENRILANEDFNDDTKDAGELGAGHTVTAFYEIIPAGSDEQVGSVDPLKYISQTITPSDDLMTVKLRYKEPKGFTSKLIEQSITLADLQQRSQVSDNFNFASAIVEFGLLLRGSEHRGNASYASAIARARQLSRINIDEHRSEAIKLMMKAQQIDNGSHYQPVIDIEPMPTPVPEPVPMPQPSAKVPCEDLNQTACERYSECRWVPTRNRCPAEPGTGGIVCKAVPVWAHCAQVYSEERPRVGNQKTEFNLK